MTETLRLLSLLSDPTRFQAMRLLWDGRERCVCELMEMLGKGQSCVSRHMAALKEAGLLVDRRDAQWVRYRRNPALSKAVVAFIEAAFALPKSPKRKNT